MPTSKILADRTGGIKSRRFRLALPSRRCRLALCITLALGHYSAFAADITASPTEPVKGRAPTASTPVFVNKSVAGKNPAIDDQIEASYTFADVDGDAEDPSNGVFQWKADASNIANATTKTFVPTAAQLKKFLTFEATPGTNPLITDPDRADTAVTSPPSGAPVLPSRAQLASEYLKAPSRMSWGDAYMYCAGQNERLPTAAELQTLFVTYTRANAVGEQSLGDIANTYGWDSRVHWTKSNVNDARADYVYIESDGHVAGNGLTQATPFACIKAGAAEGLPTVTDITIPNAAVGTPVTAEYTYIGNATIPDRSRFQWYTATAVNGTGKVMATGHGATTTTYTPVATDAGKYLMIEITPASFDTVASQPVTTVSSQAVPALEQPMPAGTILAVNGHNFSIGSSFPSTGFKGATFQVLMSGSSANNSNYTWSVDQSWVSVDSSGKVLFSGEPTSTSKTFKLTATDKSTLSRYTKNFNINLFFTSNGSNEMNWQNAANYCSGRGGQPSRQQLTNETLDRPGSGASRNTGSLWPEWGHMGSYPSSGFVVDRSHWTSEAIDASNHWGILLSNGKQMNIGNNVTVYVVCRKVL